MLVLKYRTRSDFTNFAKKLVQALHMKWMSTYTQIKARLKASSIARQHYNYCSADIKGNKQRSSEGILTIAVAKIAAY